MKDKLFNFLLHILPNMNDKIQKAVLEMVASGQLTFDLPRGLVEDSIRSQNDLLVAIIAHELQNGSFPTEQVHAMMEGRVAEWKGVFQLAIIEAIKRMEECVESKRIISIAVRLPNERIIQTGLQHRCFPDLLDTLGADLNAYLVGPAGAGKTTGGKQAAKALDVPFSFTGAITSEYKLTGFIDAQGRVVSTAFRRAYEHGGLFLFDEIDASMPQAVLAFNAAIANGQMDFPDGTIDRHPKFYCMAAANTFGVGSDRVYVGRNQMDGATIDRYAFIEWGYDEDLEREIVRADGGDLDLSMEWVDYVQDVRQEATELRVKHVISPRASQNGARLLNVGMERKKVEKMVLWKGVDDDTVKKIRGSLDEDAALGGEEGGL